MEATIERRIRFVLLVLSLVFPCSHLAIAEMLRPIQLANCCCDIPFDNLICLNSSPPMRSRPFLWCAFMVGGRLRSDQPKS
jgi:hypothetical protein